MRTATLLLLLALPACQPADDAPATDAESDTDTDTDTDTDADTDTDTDTDCYTLSDGACVQETWVDLPELEPTDGVYTLTLAASEVRIGGKRHCARVYNGVYPGPTLVTSAREGDAPRQIRVDLHNALADHDYRSLDGDETCHCTDSTGAECLPEGHGGCDTEPSADDCSCVNEDGDTCEHMYDFNLTNLHAHGSHIRPNAAADGGCTPDGDLLCRDCDTDACDGDESDDVCYHGDDVLAQVHPGTGARYRWDLDEDGTHHAGLNWYHPHIHGTTAIQVASGAAGAWVIRGDVDEVPGLANARERVMVFTTPPIGDNGFAELPEGTACTDDTITFNDFSVLGDVAAGQANLINGVQTPRMVTAPGQVERWRILSSSFLDESMWGIYRGTDHDCTEWSTDAADTLQLVQYARDGITLPSPVAEDYWFMASGYRIEGYVGGEGVLQDGDTWCVVVSRFLQDNGDGEPVSGSEEPTIPDIVAALSGGDLVGILNVTASAGTATETAVPTDAALAAVAPSTTIDGVSAEDRCADAAAVENADELDEGVVLQVGPQTADLPDPCDCDGHNLNCTEFGDRDRSVYAYDRDLPVDTVEQWRVAASLDGHPFHIHINPFLVCPNDNPFDPIPYPHWRDTYLVNLDRKVDLITKYSAFTGDFVMHCHKLTHEDEGMMQLLRVCDPETDPTCGDYDWRYCAEGDLQCVQSLAATECALDADGVDENLACAVSLGAPDGVCGENACGSDDDCGGPFTCQDYVCALP